MFKNNPRLSFGSISWVAIMAANFVVLRAAADQPRFPHNVFCHPRPAPIATKNHIYPYHVLLSRCQGSVGLHPPTKVRCIPVEEVPVIFRATDLHINRNIIFELKNHTKCGSECVAKPSDCSSLEKFEDCQCKCPSVLPASATKCPTGQRWSQSQCRCTCSTRKSCGSGRAFDEKACSCQCKKKRVERCIERGLFFDHEKCRCLRHSESTGSHPGFGGMGVYFWICLMLAEFIILLVVFQLFLYHKKSGFVYMLRNHFRRKHGSWDKSSTNKQCDKSVCGIDSRIIDEADRDVYFLHSRYQTVEGQPL